MDGTEDPLTSSPGNRDNRSFDLTEGDHVLILQGVSEHGDSPICLLLCCRYNKAQTVIKLSPTNRLLQRERNIDDSRFTDADALFTLYCDGEAVFSNKSIAQLNGTIDNEGLFFFTVPLPNAHSASMHRVVITASDIVGNATSEEAQVVHGGLSNIQYLEIYADGVKWDNHNVVSHPLNTKTYKLSLVARTKNGVSFVITDERLVSWECFAVEGSASIDDEDTLTVGAGAIGYVIGNLLVIDNRSLTASLTFGGERFSSGTGHYTVAVSATQGGSVTGGGIYAKGETVILKAVPDEGYDFIGWTFEGVSVANPSAATVSFVMPEGNVVANAKFVSKAPVINPSIGSSDRSYVTTAQAGRKVSFMIPQGINPNLFVPYYYENGKKVYVAMSYHENGILTFIAPVTGEYGFEERKLSFADINSHWAKDYILSVAARDLFMGVGNDKFDPNGAMTRAMFVTVLWRLAGKPSAGGSVPFKDAVPNAYYSEALVWVRKTVLFKDTETGSSASTTRLQESRCASCL